MKFVAAFIVSVFAITANAHMTEDQIQSIKDRVDWQNQLNGLYEDRNTYQNAVNAAIKEDVADLESMNEEVLNQIQDNMSWMQSAMGSSNNRISALESRLDSVENDIDALNNGVAMSMAMSALPQAIAAGSTMLTAGVGHFNGANAVAIGASYRFANTPVTLNIHVSATESDTAAAAAIGYEL